MADRGWLRRNFPVLLGAGVSAALAFLALRNVRPGEAWRALSNVNLWWLPALVGVTLADLAIRALRWRLILAGASSNAGVKQLVRLETIGLAVNNVLFLRLGEIARAYLAARELGMPVLTSLATIFVERVLDTATLVLLFALAAWFQPLLVPASFSKTAFALVAGVIAALVALAVLDGRLRGGFLERRLAGYPRVFSFVERAALGTRSLRAWLPAAQIVALGLGLWLCDALMYWFGGRAMGLTPALIYGHSLLILSSAAASSFLPAVPGSFGTFEQTVKTLLVYLGIDPAAALSYAGFVHVVNYVVVTGLGVLFLYREGMTLSKLKSLRDAGG